MTHREILAIFGRDELAGILGVSPETVRTWYYREKIPTDYLVEIAFTKKGKKSGVTLEVIKGLIGDKK